MTTFKKTEGVKTSNPQTCIWIQEVILDFKGMTNAPIGKVVIDAEKLTFYKFGIIMGIARHSTSGIVYSNGYLNYEGFENPIIRDREMCLELFRLFNLSSPYF